MEGARYLEDGKLTVFRRAGIYYARIHISLRQYIWRSLKTSNEQAAVDLGRRLLFQLEQRVEQGLPPKSKLFSAVIDDYIRYRERDHGHGGTSAGMLRQIVRVSKFWREYAGQLAVEAIDESLLTNSGVSIVLLPMVTHYLISIEVFEVSTSEPGVP